MTEWPQDRLERFWRGLDVETRDVVSWREVYLGELIVGTTFGSYPEWTILNPHDEDKVPLEVLEAGLERLAYNKGIARLYMQTTLGLMENKPSVILRKLFGDETELAIEIPPDTGCRTAIIAAIEKLLEVKSG